MARTPQETQRLILEYLRVNPGAGVLDVFLGTVLNETAVRRGLLALLEDDRAWREVPSGHREYRYWATTQDEIETTAQAVAGEEG
jgi:hypothetical protein